MAEPHPRDPEAAEYVLGTLDAGERRAFEGAMSGDAALRTAVREWRDRLAALADPIPSVQPSPGRRALIEAALDARSPPNVLAFPARDVERLRRSRSVWRAAALACGSLAAALAIWVASAPPPPLAGPQLVAAVNRSGDLPALIVRVDPSTRLVHVRSVATEVPSGHSLELWSVAANAAPRSLGLVATGAARVSLPAGPGPIRDGTTIAVSVEPSGGSPTGAPTGPVLYSGRLVSDAP